MKVAYFCEPQAGGTFSFFTRVRPALAARDVDLRCIPPLSAEHFKGTPYDGLDGVDYVRFPENDFPAATRVLIDHLIERRYDAVLVLPGTDVVCTNIVRYLPRTIRATARVPMITRGAYAPTRALAASLDLVFAVSRRVADDLTARYSVPSDIVRVAYNGAQVRDRLVLRTHGESGRPFTLLYSGRLSDLDKGVLLLPDILDRILKAGVNARLAVVGEGPDAERLRTEFARRRILDRVDMPGVVPLERVDEMLAEADCFVLPSRFEGCPNALLEAMASGCACVAARIVGSVDQIIEDGKSGILADVADTASFSQAVVRLARDPGLCRAIGEAAQARIADRFTIEHTAAIYAKAFKELKSAPDRREPPSSLDRYQVPQEMKPTWRTRIPDPIKNFARKWLERFGVSS